MVTPPTHKERQKERETEKVIHIENWIALEAQIRVHIEAQMNLLKRSGFHKI